MQGDYGRLCGNYRPVQKLNGRKIVTLVPKGEAGPSPAPKIAAGPTQPSGATGPTVPVSGEKTTQKMTFISQRFLMALITIHPSIGPWCHNSNCGTKV